MNKSDVSGLKEMYKHIASGGIRLLEEYIVLHPDIPKLYLYSVNTYLIATVVTEGIAYVVCAFIRIGNNVRFVDNINLTVCWL